MYLLMSVWYLLMSSMIFGLARRSFSWVKKWANLMNSTNSICNILQRSPSGLLSAGHPLLHTITSPLGRPPEPNPASFRHQFPDATNNNLFELLYKCSEEHLNTSPLWIFIPPEEESASSWTSRGRQTTLKQVLLAGVFKASRAGDNDCTSRLS